jgi:hypothetical protein
MKFRPPAARGRTQGQAYQRFSLYGLSSDRRTNAQEQPIVAALGDRLEEVCGHLNHWGQLCLEAGAFPPDILKRAAG